MLAYHPITGKEIRVIQTDASLWKEAKTLWYSTGENGLIRGGQGWDILSEAEFAEYRLLLKPVQMGEFLESSRRCKLLFMSRAALGDRTVEEFKELRIGNIMGLEELHELYPHIEGPWDGTVEDAVLLVAGLLRYRRVAGAWGPRAERLGLKKEEAPAPPRLWWVTQTYTPPQAKRRREIQRALELNLQSPLIDKVLLLQEKEQELPQSHKLEVRILGKRLTYADVFRAAATMPPDVWLVFANADIAIDTESWRQLWQINMEKKFLALLRYDVPASGILEEATLFGPRADSQDTWVIRVADIQALGTELLAKTLEIPFGKMGCDNAIALEMLRKKFLVVNPALSLKTYHFHSSEIRTYNKEDVVQLPMFHYIHPTGLNDLNAVIKDTGVQPRALAPINRPIRGSGANKWLSIVNRTLATGDTPFKASNLNPLTPSPELVLNLENCFANPEGLVFDCNKMYIGPSVLAQKTWAKTPMNTLTPSLESKQAIVVPFTVSSREDYILQVLSKVLRLGEGVRGIVDWGWEFMCPDQRETIEALECFDWAVPRLPVIKHEEDTLLYCKKARTLLISETSDVTSSEDIEALRQSLAGWESNPQDFGCRKRIVLVEDGLDADFVQELEDVLERAWDVKVVFAKSSAHRIVDCLKGAWGIVYGSGSIGAKWSWVLPRGAYCFEVFDDECRGGSEGVLLSGAAGLEHRVIPRTSGTDAVFTEIWKEEEAWKVASAVGTDVPTIWVPRRDLEGYFAHPGDSFREMVRLWAKAGFCRVREHPSAVMVWWGAVGAEGTLLYDRPNHDWRMAAPLVEKSWKKALFGNPRPPVGRGAPWFFWPRRPELVEKLVAAGEDGRGWRDRREGLVFYGKIENKVQEKRRTVENWENVCNEWVCVTGSKPHRWSQEEYLKKLANARFGLCLAGYGLKCHREVECMAMGCVPICAPEVDMDSYANPPVEGVHYFRVKGAADAGYIVDTTYESDWERMSVACRKWWKENCSVEGSFKLTQRLVDGRENTGTHDNSSGNGTSSSSE